MMIDARNNYRMCPKYPFTASQWEELEQQTLVFRYLVAGVPVPPHLISTLITTPSSSSSSRSVLLPQQLPLPIGWGCFQVGFGRKVDPEPGRCRRTDGKKWRCSKDAFPDSKYCEKHMHRGKSKSKKQSQKQSPNHISNYSLSSPSNTNTNTSNCAQKCPSESPFYPFLSPHSSSHESTMPTQYQSGPTNLLGHAGKMYYGQPTKDIKFDSLAKYRH